MFDKPTPFYGFFRKWAVKRTDFAFWGKKIYFHLDNFIKIAQNISVVYRCVAQFGRALRSGRRGRRFKSCHTDRRAAGICLRRFLLPKNPLIPKPGQGFFFCRLFLSGAYTKGDMDSPAHPNRFFCKRKIPYAHKNQ